MALPKQRANESDSDFAVRLEKSKEARRKSQRKYREANREAVRKRNRKYNRKYREANGEALRERNRESQRKYREANGEALREYYRNYREANKEAIRESQRKYREANREAVRKRNREIDRKRREVKALANAKGGPLRSSFLKAQRPKMLTMLILQEAEWVCEFWGISQDRKWENEVLQQAASHVRDFPFYPIRHFEPGESLDYARKHGLTSPTNPWYHTDYLHDSTIFSKCWGANIRATWRNKRATWRNKA
jgi:hypothetical protein